MVEIDLVQDWGLSPSHSATRNSSNFNLNFASVFPSGNEDYYRLYLRPGTYDFNLVTLGYASAEIKGLQLVGSGIGRTVLRFSDKEHTHLELRNLKNFTISDFSIDGSAAMYEGGLWVKEGCESGIIERVEINNAYAVSCVVSGNSEGSENLSRHITVRDCTVRNQRHWSGDAKAMFIAGDNAEHITFERCKTFSAAKDGSAVSVADHFDSDNARHITYRDCFANGEGSDGGAAYWNEGEETISTYFGCRAYKTQGGLASGEHSIVQAYGMEFIEAGSGGGWTVRSFSRQKQGLLLDGALFLRCGTPSGYGYGGIHIDSSITVTNCRFVDTPSGAFNVSAYSPGDVQWDDSYAIISNCQFDKGVMIHSPYPSDGPSVKNITVSECSFDPGARFITRADPRKYRIVIRGCLFTDTAMQIENTLNIRITGNTFYNNESEDLSAIQTSETVSGLVSGNLFSGFDRSAVIDSSGQDHQLQLHQNIFQ